MSALAFLSSWGNAPFAIALGVVAVFALLQATGVLGLIAGGGEGDAEHDLDVEHDVDHDFDGDASGHHAGGDHDADGGDRGLGVGAAALGVLGVGTIPLSIIWQTYAFVFGAVGISCNLHYMGAAGGVPAYTLAWTFPAGLVAGFFAVGAMKKTLGPVLSSKGQEATSRAQLVGQIGVVISTKVDHAFGEVRIRDKSGHDLRVVCKLTKDATVSPTERQNVVVVDYDDRDGIVVAPIDDELEAGRDSRGR